MSFDVAFEAPTSKEVPTVLDWLAFTAARFPGRRRHDLEAVFDYGVYRRSRVTEERRSESPRIEADEHRRAEVAAVHGWEDEGGA